MTGLGNKIADTSAECVRELNRSALFPVVEKLRVHGTYESVLRSVLASSNREQALRTLAGPAWTSPGAAWKRFLQRHSGKQYPG
jgi:hypothetical protein